MWYRIGTGDTAHGVTVVAIVVVGWVDVAAVEVQVVSVGGTVDRTRPIVAVGTWILHRGVSIHIAGSKMVNRIWK